MLFQIALGTIARLLSVHYGPGSDEHSQEGEEREKV